MEEAKKYLKEQGWKEDGRGAFDFNGMAKMLNNYSKELQHHRDITVGLWATDRPDLIEDPKKLLFEIK